MKKNVFLIAALLSVLTSAHAQRAVQLSLKQMVQQAGTIVHGTISETRTGKDPVTGLPATWITVDVKEDFYGAPGQSFTFKQIGGEMNGMAYRPADVPSYRANEELVLLLYPAHGKTGFRSPVGLGQGKFVVRTPAAPRKKVVEQVTPSHMLLRAERETASLRQLTLDGLRGEIRSLVRTEKGGVR